MDNIVISLIVVGIVVLAQYKIKKDKQEYEEQLLQSQKIIHNLTAHSIELKYACEDLLEGYDALHQVAIDAIGSEEEVDKLYIKKKEELRNSKISS